MGSRVTNPNCQKLSCQMQMGDLSGAAQSTAASPAVSEKYKQMHEGWIREIVHLRIPFANAPTQNSNQVLLQIQMCEVVERPRRSRRCVFSSKNE